MFINMTYGNLKSKPGSTNYYVPDVSMFTSRTPMSCKRQIHAPHTFSSVCIHQNLNGSWTSNLKTSVTALGNHLYKVNTEAINLF